jgi:hypothetical protein
MSRVKQVTVVHLYSWVGYASNKVYGSGHTFSVHTITSQG